MGTTFSPLGSLEINVIYFICDRGTVSDNSAVTCKSDPDPDCVAMEWEKHLDVNKEPVLN